MTPDSFVSYGVEMKMITLLILLTYFTISPTILADEKAIEKELTNFIDVAVVQQAAANKKESQKQSLLRIQSNIASKQYSQALNLIQAHIQLNPESTRTASALSSAILRELTKQAEKEVKRKKAFFNEFAKALTSAKAIEEIDHWLIKLNEEIQRDGKHRIYTQPAWNPATNYIPNSSVYRGFWTANTRYQGYCGMPTQLRQETQTALRIATAWQDYLHALDLGDKRTARSHMNNIASYSASFVYIPRSKILKLSGNLMPQRVVRENSNELLEIKDVKLRLKTTADAILLYHELYNLSSSKMTPKVNYLKKDLRKLEEALNYVHSNNVKYGIEKLKALKSSPYLENLAVNILTNYVKSALNLPDNFVIKAGEDSLVWSERYLNKLAVEKKWGELHQAMLITKHMKSGIDLREQDISALKLLIAAKNYQGAGLYHRAAVAYRQILGKGVYTEAINNEASSQLKKIRKDYPESYLLSHDMHGHDSNYHSKSRESYLKKLIVIELQKIAKEIKGDKKNEQKDQK